MEKEKIRRLVLQAGQGDRAAFGELYEERAGAYISTV